MNEKIAGHLANAIGTMRGFLEDAERRVADCRTDEDAIERVVHCFAWGQANAASSIESALLELRRQRERTERVRDAHRQA